jgi:hypothetical protein
VRTLFLDLCGAIGFPLAVIETRRDLERQRYYKAHGVSRTLKSSHLPQEPNGLSLAVDVCPKPYLVIKGWAPGAPLWLELTEAARDLGLACGADWATFKDWPHLYLPKCACAEREAA